MAASTNRHGGSTAALDSQGFRAQTGSALPIDLSASETPSRLHVRVVLLSILGLWLAYFVIFTARGMVVGLEFESELILRRGLVVLAGMAATFGLWLVLRLFDHRSLALQVTAAVLLAIPTALLIAQTNHLVFASLQERLQARMAAEQGFSISRDEFGNVVIEGPSMSSTDDDSLGPAMTPRARIVVPNDDAHEHWLRLVERALSQFFLLIAWAALYFALLAGVRAKDAERRGERFRSAAKAAELRSLRYQVNPHFLFNALNSLSALVITDKSEKAEEMIQALAGFYRHSLADDPTSDVALDDEFDLQRQYLAIEQVRFPNRLRTEFILPEDLARCRVPGMILQPLVENSVKYGVSASSGPVTIVIEAREEYGRLVLTVADDGKCGAGDPASGSGFGIGLANVRDRLTARFGNEANIVSGPAIDGYETEIRMPLVRHGR
ncbi:sensor histidine kinase [Qipengyuania spongiae]|uniref:Histidine kinase n=1 Tax=Qipengyuania spongiae TaxID=2909673 RepID=A0ABY5T3U1_9SPHN|nr:histidine kinase [Qipengyuania spongiae]UVI40006.1 histidine kinase [Qipengyuania spongiae]